MAALPWRLGKEVTSPKASPSVSYVDHRT
jgi:hypothetical protein